MSESTYFYEQAGTAAGPLSATELIAQGVRRDTLVWTAGMENWMSAGQVDALSALFAAVPPPLPVRTGPPPLPAPAAPVHRPPPAVAHAPADPVVPVAAPNPLAARFAPRGYSLPLLGKFKADREVWAMDSPEHFGAFAQNADLIALLEEGFKPQKSYQFRLLDAQGNPLLLLYKTKAPFFNPSRLIELHVVDAHNQLLGICKRVAGNGLTTFLSVIDAPGRHLIDIKMASVGSRDWVLEGPAGAWGRVRRSRPAGWSQFLVEYQNDRFELIFEPHTTDFQKALGIGAVVTAYLSTLQR